MKSKTDPKASQGAEIWRRIEALRARLESACLAFDELYGYVYTLKAEHRRRAEQVATDLIKPRAGEQPF